MYSMMELILHLVQKQQLIQNAAAHLLTGVCVSQHIKLVLKNLLRLPVCHQAEFKMLLLIKPLMACG